MYRIPTILGRTRLVMCDPKAIAHCRSKETYGYVLTRLSRMFVEIMVRAYASSLGVITNTSRQIGRGLMWAEGDSHKRCVTVVFHPLCLLTGGFRQRKTLTPAFSNSAIRHLTPIFIDSAYKVKNAWDGLLEPSGEAVIDVQEW